MKDWAIKSNTWYWVRWTSTVRAATGGQPRYTEVLPALPYRDEHGAVVHWDCYHGELPNDQVTVLEEIKAPYRCIVCGTGALEDCDESKRHA